jgi:hypothetical protein
MLKQSTNRSPFSTMRHELSLVEGVNLLANHGSNLNRELCPLLMSDHVSNTFTSCRGAYIEQK